jgi:ammonia channel protein AmtB
LSIDEFWTTQERYPHSTLKKKDSSHAVEPVLTYFNYKLTFIILSLSIVFGAYQKRDQQDKTRHSICMYIRYLHTLFGVSQFFKMTRKMQLCTETRQSVVVMREEGYI